jgi:hypothetical protein
MELKEDKKMKKTMNLCDVSQGEPFVLDGVKFVKLADEADLALCLTDDVALKNVPFEDDDADREDHNNFINSNLEKAIARWVREKHPAIYGAVVERPIDLTTMDGMTDYGEPLVFARVLTIDEYRKYRHFIPLASEPYWLATGYTTLRSPSSNADSAYYVITDGSLRDGGVCGAYFVARPALYLKSSISVSVEADDETCKQLADYTDTELIDELYQRRRKSYDPD